MVNHQVIKKEIVAGPLQARAVSNEKE